MMRTKVEKVTKPQAKRWLRKNKTNRPVRRYSISAFKNLINTGQFLTTHQGIAFDSRNNLIDGQHRLLAFLESDAEVLEVMVTYNADPATYEALDCGIARSLSDRVALSKDPVTNQMMTRIARFLLRLEWGYGHETAPSGAGKPTPATIRQVVKQYRDQLDIVVPMVYSKQNKSVPAWTGRAPFIGAVVQYMSIEPARGLEFLYEVVTGDGLKSGSPILALYNRLSRKYTNGDLWVAVCSTIYCWHNEKEVRMCGRRNGLSAVGFRYQEAA